MRASLHEGWVFAVVLAGCILASHSFEEVVDELQLEPSKCGVYVVDVESAIFNVTVDTSAFPKDCEPDTFLKTTGLHNEGSCIMYRWKHLMCGTTIEKQEDVCDEWAILGKQFEPANATDNPFTALEEGWTCGKRIHYIGFISSCPQNVTLSLKLRWSALPDDERKFCRLAGERGKKFLEKITVEQLVLGIVAAFIVVLGMSVWVCAQAPCCPFHRWLKTLSEDEEEEDVEARRSQRRRTYTHRFNPDSVEEALLEQEVEERKARQRRRQRPVKKDNRPDQATIPE